MEYRVYLFDRRNEFETKRLLTTISTKSEKDLDKQVKKIYSENAKSCFDSLHLIPVK